MVSLGELNMHAMHEYACICILMRNYIHLHVHIYISCMHCIRMQAYACMTCMHLHMHEWHVWHWMHICMPHPMYTSSPLSTEGQGASPWGILLRKILRAHDGPTNIPQEGGGAIPSPSLGSVGHWPLRTYVCIYMYILHMHIYNSYIYIYLY